jgi:hypothetical protein
MGKSAEAGRVATAAEKKAAEYEALASRNGEQSVNDGKALLKTEAGAMVSLLFLLVLKLILKFQLPGLHTIVRSSGGSHTVLVDIILYDRKTWRSWRHVRQSPSST